jgi:hypothetical protein
MIYIGFVIPVEEALRLLKLPDNFTKTFYDTGPIQTYLEERGSKLRFKYIDKGACLFGLPVRLLPEASVEDTILAMIHAKRNFQYEIKAIKIDISKVNINRVEEDSWTVENPEPYVILV